MLKIKTMKIYLETFCLELELAPVPVEGKTEDLAKAATECEEGEEDVLGDGNVDEVSETGEVFSGSFVQEYLIIRV